jgi:UDP-N-acetylmuramate--alanine ligase
MKLRIGILMGGISREREISFAGGRTVYDNLNKDLFEAVPLFLDSTGNLVVLHWSYLYKGTIRDFYPPVSFLPKSQNSFQVYAESLCTEDKDVLDPNIPASVGELIQWEELGQRTDFIFLCLHGPFGEDGRVQGLLEQIGLPYSGSGIFGSAVGIDKGIQKQLMSAMGFDVPPYHFITRNEWLNNANPAALFDELEEKLGFPLVVKASSQGSSIGISILKKKDLADFVQAVDRSFFREHLSAKAWFEKSANEKIKWLRDLTDIRSGIGFPLNVTCKDKRERIYHPEQLLELLNAEKGGAEWILESDLSETGVLFESFISGREFSCIVLENETEEGLGASIALPPTEIIKADQFFDYRSKYLPGLARKVTPIDLPEKEIKRIAQLCEKLFKDLRFDVYARIDGFYSAEGKIFLNDPNTTSGMMPSSFFFHQAAEIGLNPSQFLTYIIRTSLVKRLGLVHRPNRALNSLQQLDDSIARFNAGTSEKIPVAVILGGYSSERHISVESGRNIYEKLSSSPKYRPLPVFLTGDEKEHRLFVLPVHVLLKDNADDIREKVMHYQRHPFVEHIAKQAAFITKKYSNAAVLDKPREIAYQDLASLVKTVFIALHGRPGEDGAVQKKLDALGIPYNGSGSESSSTTINKYLTNEILYQNGMHVAKHQLVERTDWLKDADALKNQLKSDFGFPLIAKPVDDGCSSAVRKINNESELDAFARLIFRDKNTPLEAEAMQLLSIRPNEEFPAKQQMLIEELISKNGAGHFLEITGGLLTRYNQKGEIEYEVFEASEALSEGAVLSLEEKFLAGEGQNITPARYSFNAKEREILSARVKEQLEKAARVLKVEGYARIDAFVRIFPDLKAEVVFIEVNSLPGMTPATCIFHQTALQGYKPYDFIDKILDFSFARLQQKNKKLKV